MLAVRKLAEPRGLRAELDTVASLPLSERSRAAADRAQKHGPVCSLEGEWIGRKGLGHGVRASFRAQGLETCLVLGNLS